MIRFSAAKHLSRQAGSTLIEAMIAIVVLMVCVTGILSIFPLSAQQNATIGEEGTRSVEYAQDKMEQLLAVPFTGGEKWDITEGFIDQLNASGTGTGAGGGVPSTTYGSIDPANPVAGYVDYCDVNGVWTGAGNPNTNPAVYARQWSITDDATGNIKTISVLAYAKSSLGGAKFKPPSTKLVAYKVNLQ
jgi:hypothetical protein